MKKFLIFALLLPQLIIAQRTAYIHRDSILNSMPQMKKAQTELNNYLTEIEKEIKSMQQEYQQKITEFNQKKDSMPEIVKQNKIKEIQELDKRIRDFQVQAQKDYLQKQKDLLQPIYDLFDQTVKKVAKDKKFDVIKNIDASTIYVNPKYIITEDVMKALKIKQ